MFHLAIRAAILRPLKCALSHGESMTDSKDDMVFTVDWVMYSRRGLAGAAYIARIGTGVAERGEL